MKAARYTRFGGPDVLEIVDLPDPHPGPGQIRVAVHAAGVNPTDCAARQGMLGGTPPLTTGREVAGVVDEIGDGVTGVGVGERVVGFSDDEDGAGAGAAELALVRHYARLPDSLGFAQTAGIPVVAETAARSLRALGIDAGHTLLVHGAAGGVGGTAVQLAVAHGARVIGTAGPRNHEYLRELGAEPVTYGPGLVDRVRRLSPSGVDRALDVAGRGALPDLIELTGAAESVVTIADYVGARRYGVRFSRGEDGRALDVLPLVLDLMAAGRFRLPVEKVVPLRQIADAHRLSEGGHVRGKVVLAVR